MTATDIDGDVHDDIVWQTSTDDEIWFGEPLPALYAPRTVPRPRTDDPTYADIDGSGRTDRFWLAP